MYRVLDDFVPRNLGCRNCGWAVSAHASPEERYVMSDLDAQRGVRSGVEAMRQHEMTCAPRQQKRPVNSNDATNYPPVALAIGSTF